MDSTTAILQHSSERNHRGDRTLQDCAMAKLGLSPHLRSGAAV